jgi:hypothetical protein
MDPNHVPHLSAESAAEVDVPVGPDNPEKALDDTWTAYWDDEAGAVYYYNSETGEASKYHRLLLHLSTCPLVHLSTCPNCIQSTHVKGTLCNALTSKCSRLTVAPTVP